MQSSLFAATNLEKESAQPGMHLQNKSMLKIDLDGECFARTGSMVAYQGNVQFTALGSGSASTWLKSKLTGEGVPLMKLSGKGDVMLADRAKEIHLLDLGPGDAITVNGANILAFEPTVSYDIKIVQGMGMLSAAGMFNCVFTGPGRIAITTDGYPLTLTVDGPTYADPHAAICWSAGLQTGYHRADQLGLGTLIGRSTGETFTMSFTGSGFVIIQPSEHTR
jgi:uncharacterized protein (AIM24 family)